ncbi:MAG TPA: class I SAM-dependent methyltransferase [Anaerolineales bacterium]|nr:class I SAM-dependent methyltransferase [Anaerolineales bacterium]
MKLSDIEFRAMDSWWRRWGQEHVEVPLFQRMGLDVRDKDILEIGCGNGHGAYLLNQSAPRSYIGLDLMEEQVGKARQRYPGYQFLVQDANDLSQFEDASKDVIIVFGVLHHIPEWRRVIDEVQRVLRPGGNFFVEEPRGMDLKLFEVFFRWGHPDSDFGSLRMEQYLKSRGFEICSKQWTPLMTMYRAQKSLV